MTAAMITNPTHNGATIGPGETTPSPRLAKAAHEFEGQMMKELLKPMTRDDAPANADDDTDSGSGGALGDFASEALAQALSERGGLGIADRILKELSHSGNRHEIGKITGNLHRDTVIKASE
jgi:Rod binding domain-containing protein